MLFPVATVRPYCFLALIICPLFYRTLYDVANNGQFGGGRRQKSSIAEDDNYVERMVRQRVGLLRLLSALHLLFFDADTLPPIPVYFHRITPMTRQR